MYSNIYHQVHSGPDGSTSLNFAVRYPGFDIDHEFDIHKLDIENGTSVIVRQGCDDQHGHM